MTYIVVLGLVVVVVLVVVLVALGLRAGRSSRDEDDWISDDRPRGRRAPAHEDEDELDNAYGTGYETGYDAGYDRRVAGAPLSPPPPTPSAPATGHTRPGDKMDDDDYWATITFDKPKFPWQHDNETERPPNTPDPLDEPIVPAGAEQAPAAPKSAPLPAPSLAAGHQMDYPAQDYPAQPVPETRIDPLDGSLPAPGPLAASNDPLSGRYSLTGPDPLGLPVSTRTDSLDPEATQIYPSPSETMASASYGDGSYGDASSSYGDASYPGGGTNTFGGASGTGVYGGPPRGSYPVGGASSNSPSLSGTGTGSGGDTDSHRLPTVDELLQRIQADRRKTGATASGAPGSAAASASSSPGMPLADPLNDPLGTGPLSGNTGPMGTTGPLSGPGDSGYGSGGSWPATTPAAPAASSTPPAFTTDPLGIGPLGIGSTGGSHTPPNGVPTGSGLSGGGYGPTPSSSGGQGYPADGYPSAPVYGESPRYDDPLGGYGTASGRDSYSALGGSASAPPPQSQPPRADEPGRYSDFTGSSYGNGPASDPLGIGGYGPGGGSGPTFYGSPTPDPAYGPPPEQGYGPPPGGDTGQPYPPTAYGTPAYGPAGPTPGYGQPEPGPQPQQQRGGDEWDTYRDFRS